MTSFIIAGIRSDIGIAYAKQLQHYGKVYGISRRDSTIEGLEYTHITCDLMNAVDDTIFNNIHDDNIVYIHLPGEFRFEDENHPIIDNDNDGLDDSIYHSNVTTFENITPALYRLVKNTNLLKIVAIGSTADLYNVPYWNSFTVAKNKLRALHRKFFGDHENNNKVSSVFINVSTTDGEQLAGERPYIDKTYVLQPTEIVSQSLEWILLQSVLCIEINILKSNPEWLDDDYFKLHNIKARWYHDMYGT
jgi:NADP-dependent 3-hydroxy acid dehydrogenase YdfG